MRHSQLNNLSKSNRVAIYARVSTDEQARDNKTSLILQEEKVRQFCESQDYTVDSSHVYIEKGYSGSLDVVDRPAMSAMFQAARNREFDLIIVYKLDRFFRNQRKALNALHELTELGVGFKSATQPEIDTSNSSGRFMMQMMNAFSELEREMIRERMLDGKLKAAADGKWVTGVPPYGYRINKKTKELVLCKEEAEVVKKFYDWLVYEKCSLREITRRAIKQNLPTPYHKPKEDGKRIGGKWYKRTINRILVNEVYTGQFYYNKYKRPFKFLDAVLDEEHQRPEEDHILITVPPIISQELFEKSIQQLRDNRRFQKRNEKRPYLFAGLLYSGYSGKKLQSGYQTPKKDKKSPCLGKYYHVYIPALERIGTDYDCYNPEGQCAESRIMPVWDTLLAILSDPENVIPQLTEYTFKTSDEAKVKKELAQLEKQFGILKTKKQRIQEAYYEVQMDKDDYNSRMTLVRKNERDLTIQKQKLSQMLLKKTERKDRDKIIKSLHSKYQAKIDNLSYEEQQHILRLFVEKITLYHKKGYAEVAFKFPLNTKVPTSAPASVTEGKHMRLVLHVKIKSESDRRKEILKSNPLMQRGNALAGNI